MKANRSIKERMEDKRRAEAASTARRRELLQKNLSSHRISELNDEIEKLKNEVLRLQELENERRQTILQDLLAHSDDKKGPFTSETMSLAIELRSISPKAYSILVKKLNFPKESLIEAAIKDVIGDLPSKLTSIESCGEVINTYKEKERIPKTQTIDACLAVDALYFKPDVSFTDDGEINGLLFQNSKVSISEKTFSLFTKDPNEMEKFLAVNSNDIIRAGFVFQVQPYDVALKPFIVHIKPSINGKASSEIVDLLKEIRSIAKNRHINIKSFAFDGDSAYKHLHEAYYESYIHKAINTHTINFTHSRTFRVVSDFLHIIKRLRYRLLSSLIHAGFTHEDNIILVTELQEILSDIPSTVWCNDSFTKMHDKLPLTLFKLENFLKLMNENHTAAAAYWFPIALSITALSSPNIGFEYRFYLLQSVFWFLVFYKEAWDNSVVTLNQKKYKDNKDVLFYSIDLLIEFTNTIHCQIQLMSTVKNLSYDRNSTTPLEHKFGNARVRAHDQHTLAKFLKTISIMQGIDTTKLKELTEFQKELQIRGRSNSFGVTVEDNTDETLFSIYESTDDGSVLEDEKFTPRAFAQSILVISGFPLEYPSVFDPVEVVEWGIFFLTELSNDLPTKRYRRRITSAKTFFSINQSTKTFHLTEQRMTKKCRKKEIVCDLLSEKFGPNFTKKDIQKIFHFIADHSESFVLPRATASKDKLIDFLADHIGPFYSSIIETEFE